VRSKDARVVEKSRSCSPLARTRLATALLPQHTQRVKNSLSAWALDALPIALTTWWPTTESVLVAHPPFALRVSLTDKLSLTDPAPQVNRASCLLCGHLLTACPDLHPSAGTASTTTLMQAVSSTVNDGTLRASRHGAGVGSERLLTHPKGRPRQGRARPAQGQQRANWPLGS